MRVLLLFIVLLSETTLATWSTSTAFLYSLNETSTTGFRGSSGSGFSCSFGKTIFDEINLGFGTTAIGAEKSNKNFYRLSAGPTAAIKILDRWNIGLATSFFKESGLNSSGTQQYKSRGGLYKLSWERISKFSSRVNFSLGGFWSRHFGNLKSTQTDFNPASANIGNSRGLQIALIVLL